MHTSLLVLTSFLVGAGPLEIAGPAGQTQTIKAALSQLASNNYAARQSAFEQLWAAGEAALPELVQATHSKNAEVRYRAQFIVDNLRMGITFDTPDDILREVYRFQSDSVEQRRHAMHRLETANRPRIVLALLQSENDVRLRREWSASLERCLVRTIAAGKLAEAEDTLRRASGEETWMRHWAAYAQQRGLLEEEIAQAASFTGSSQQSALRRVYLLRAKGELDEACRIAEPLDEDLRLSLLAENRDWETAARLLAEQLPTDMPLDDRNIERLLLTAAYWRLAGHPSESEKLLVDVKSQADTLVRELDELEPNSQQTRRELVARIWHLAKGLLLNGRYDEAMQVMSKKQPSFVFDLLCEQQRYGEAFASVGAAFPAGPDANWFHSAADVSNAETADERFSIAQFVLRQLCVCGRRDEAVQQLGVLIEMAKRTQGSGRLRMLCDTARRIALPGTAIEIASLVIERENSTSVLSVLYPSRASQAQIWWEHFRVQYDGESLLQSLQRVDEVLKPGQFRHKGEDFQTLVSQAADRIPSLTGTKRADWCRDLAETCLLHGREDLAVKYYAVIAPSSVHACLKLGDLSAAGGKWEEAASWYDRARQLDPERALPLYLYARAIKQAGEVERGNQLEQLALLMPLANTESRHELASGLKEHGYRDEAREQFELLLRTGEFESGKLIDAAKQVGNLIHQSDEMRAADCWETMLLSCLKPNWGFVENGGYIQIPQLVHKTRARGLLKAGKTEQAVQEVWASYHAAPGNTDLAEELVPLLEASKCDRDANELFARCANHLRDLVSDFPQCATFHNNIAWLFARSGRELDEALQHAQRALELEPGKASFLDTLAEVHFRRSEIAQAVVCAEQCLKIDPENAHYHAQLDRFRSAYKESP